MSPSRLRPVKRLMLIFPPMFNTRQIDTMVCPPMGIASLAAYVRDLVEVRLLDCLAEDGDRREPVSQSIDRVGMSYARIIDEIRTWAPDMVGLSCIFSSQWSAVAELTERIKQDVDSDMVVVTGGTHPSFLPESTLARSRVDYVVLGEGERGLRDLIMAHNRGGGLDRIDGIAYRDNGSIVVRPRTSWIEDLDSLPFPARDLLPMEKYFATRVPMGLHWRKVRNTPIVSSRGCPLKCPFCSSWRHWGARFRKRSAGNVLAEIAHLRDVYDVRELKWQDDNLTTDR
ncbi:MAG: B12-binding domain-containing radical SAM protein, partial [Desulfosudaceae bacterium]